jgi:hypothetical protein
VTCLSVYQTMSKLQLGSFNSAAKVFAQFGDRAMPPCAPVLTPARASSHQAGQAPTRYDSPAGGRTLICLAAGNMTINTQLRPPQPVAEFRHSCSFRYSRDNDEQCAQTK